MVSIPPLSSPNLAESSRKRALPTTTEVEEVTDAASVHVATDAFAVLRRGAVSSDAPQGMDATVKKPKRV